MDRSTQPDSTDKFPGTRPRRQFDSRLTPEEIERLRPHAPAWLVKERRGLPRLHRTFAFKSFAEAMWFTLKVGEVAERERQRPTILTTWNHVTVALESPGSYGIRRDDFVAAAEIDRVYAQRRRDRAEDDA
jgi:4a-hydroxytetrahydrobiopterin dehydratase